jgi:hypothetical protein
MCGIQDFNEEKTLVLFIEHIIQEWHFQTAVVSIKD